MTENTRLKSMSFELATVQGKLGYKLSKIRYKSDVDGEVDGLSTYLQ